MNENNIDELNKTTSEDSNDTLVNSEDSPEQENNISDASSINELEDDVNSNKQMQKGYSQKSVRESSNTMPPELPTKQTSKYPVDEKLQPKSKNNYSNNTPDNQSFDFLKWFKDNNPLYLLSVLFMLIGLHLVSSDVKASNLGVGGLLGFFAVQNLYEILMIGMALYLLKCQIQPGHGKLLLVFVMLFLGDVTFYQVRISGLSVWYGNLATIMYMGLAGLKLAAVVKVLNLKLHHWRIFYVFSSFSLIWIGPKIAYNIMDSIGKPSAMHFDPTTIIYLLWVCAGLIHLPIIIKNWYSSKISTVEYNKLVGNETTFWRYLMIFPFIMMPIQLLINVMADSSLAISQSTPSIALILPWMILAAMFAQTFWKKIVEAIIGLNVFDSAVFIIALIVAIATSKAELTISVVNFTLVISGLFITYYTRGNLANGLAIGFSIIYFSGYQLLTVGSSVVKYGTTISKTAWAGILMVVSFIFLGLGFLISLVKRDNDDK